MAILDSIRGRKPGYFESNALASLRISPIVYEHGDELTLALELENRTGDALGVDFELRDVSGLREPRRYAIAEVGNAGPDTVTFIHSGIVISKQPLLDATRARFALGNNLLRIPPHGRVVVHTQPFARASLDEAAAKAERLIGMFVALCVAVANTSSAKLLTSGPLVCLPKSWVTQPRPDDALVLSPTLLLDDGRAEHETALTRSPGCGPEEFARDKPTFDVAGFGELILGFAIDDDTLAPIHVRALDELGRLLARIPFELHGLPLAIRGYADGGDTRHAEARAKALAERRAESVRAHLSSLPGVKLQVLSARVAAGPRGVTVQLPQDTRWHHWGWREIPPMVCYAWPNVPNSYSLAAEFPLLTGGWELEPLTLSRLRAVYGHAPMLAAALVPERVRGQPRSAFANDEVLRRLDEELAGIAPRVDVAVPSASVMTRLLRPFGFYLDRLAHMLVAVRQHALRPEQLGRWHHEWTERVLAVLVDEWQPESQRGWTARLDRLRAIDNDTDLVPALVLAIAEQCARIDMLLASEDVPAVMLAQQQEFRAAVDRPDLHDILAEYDDCLARLRERVGA